MTGKNIFIQEQNFCIATLPVLEELSDWIFQIYGNEFR